MKTLLNYFLLTVLISSFVFTGCKKEEEVDQFETLTDYLTTNSMDLPQVLDAWIVGAPAEADVAAFTDSYFIIDIRSAEDYAAGHIQGAVNSTLGNVLTTAKDATKPVLVVCYTGQTASHAVVALRLSGFATAKVLKWGMSGWNTDYSGAWKNAVASGGVGNANWTTDATTAVQQFGNPTLASSAIDGADILAERVQKMLDGGLQGVASADVLAKPDDFFVNNYWTEADVAKYGHIKGAYRINPLSISGGELKNLNPESTIVTYCWTGQTSSMITAYLNVLGYNAKSLKFGANSMIHSQLDASHQFAEPKANLPVVQ